MESRAILANHRETLDALTPDDPVYIEALQLISWPLFQTPNENASEIDDALFRGQYDYYRALFHQEYSWSTQALRTRLLTSV
jgi:hypothetical protein